VLTLFGGELNSLESGAVVYVQPTAAVSTSLSSVTGVTFFMVSRPSCCLRLRHTTQIVWTD
jgi:hypothetical protein